MSLTRRFPAMVASYRWPAIAALVHVAAFDFLCYHVFYNGHLGVVLWITALAFFMALPFFCALFLSRILVAVLLPLGFFIDSIATYFVYFYRIDIRPDTLALLYETNVAEASGFIDRALVVTALAGLALGGVLARLSITDAGWRGRSGVAALLLVLPLSAVAAESKSREHRVPPQLPESIVTGTLQYFQESQLTATMAAARARFASGTYRAPDEDITIVLVIGESARADHFALNGYGRPTTPRLARHEPLSFRHVKACHPTTRVSVPCLMTRSSDREGLLGRGGSDPVFLREQSFVSLFRDAGFLTAWLSNQRVLNKNDTLITAIAAEADIVRYSRTTWAQGQDGVLLPWLREVLAHPAPRTLLVVHTIGSHWPYFNRHDAEHARFQPGCARRNPSYCSHEALVNSYDNSILYTDGFLADVIALLQERNALLVYTSDHGESLGETGFFGHGQGGRPEQEAVPLIVWTSPEFQRRHPERHAAVARHVATPVSHAYIFHSLLHCAGFAGEAVDPSLSFCRADATASLRPGR